jgi:hypothetical protein
MLGSLVAVAVAWIGEALVAVAAGEGPAPGVHDGMLHHVGLGFGNVAALPALTGGKGRWEMLFPINQTLKIFTTIKEISRRYTLPVISWLS